MKKGARIVAVLCFILGVFLIGGVSFYQLQLSAVDKSSSASIEVVIEEGTGSSSIASILKEKDLIKNEFMFKVYLRLNNKNNLKAGTYLLKKNMSVSSIVDSLEKGSSYNANAVKVTFPEGKTVSDFATVISNNTNITKEAFLERINNQEFLSELINKYWFLTADILNEDIYYPLEGYLAPDTYLLSGKDVSVDEVVITLLDQQEKNLEEYKNSFTESTPHEIFTLASMAELEGVKESDRKMIVSVFLNRLNRGMNLGSDVTTYYAFNESMDKDLTSAMFNTYNPYNTRSSQMAGRLPVGPICNPSLESITAALTPTETEALFFVADKNGNVYYTNTNAEHDAKVQEIKEKGDWIW